MKTAIRKTLACSALMLAGVLAIGQAAAQHNGPLLAAIHGDHRSDLNKARDVYRSPYDTLTFFGIEPHHTVIEAWPGGGWYTEILAPYLKENGKLIAATYDRSDNPEQGWMTGSNAAFARLVDSNPELYGDIEISQQLTQSQSAIAPAGTVDAIVDFRNAHNWLGMGADNVVMAWHAALKPGGVVGIVDHRWPADQAAIPGNGYIHEQQLIDLMTAHGFTLAGRSEINANPNDPKDHPNGVWMLPPNLRGLDDETRARNIRIGESDRMTLKFIKN
ncbi:MAG: methyltransferase [Pseudomonadota bacterium]|uniref:class I SAM-dependent methyltransferase n=1 Tax=Pseudohongiella sp. O18 TaxID=2904248 RepID=UPI001F265FBF|nr:methyltransferase [Pseudohongiella sp. O18]MEC8858899.1 methyltransferase [Pseudomonadota bacterium]